MKLIAVRRVSHSDRETRRIGLTTGRTAIPDRLAQGIAAIAVTVVGTRVFVAGGATAGIVIALALIPVWLPSLRRYFGAISLTVTALCAVVAGAWLTEFRSGSHPTSVSGLIDASLMMVGLAAAVGVILWARGILPVWLIGTLFGFGMLVTTLITGAWDASNPWKFGIGFPVMVIILSLIARAKVRAIDMAALLILAVASVATDSRYRFASLMIAAVLILWQMLPQTPSKRTSAFTTVAVFSVIAVITYNLVTAVLVEGYLGEQAQARSIDQINRSGSLIVGGRPELSASVALFIHDPLGFGSGVSPTRADIMVAKTGMWSVGYDPNNGYVESFMFGGGFELHSVAGDLWAAFGLPGLCFAALSVFLVVRGLGRTLADRSCSGLIVFLSISTLWNMLFSPIYGSLPTLVLTLGLILLPQRQPSPVGPV